MLFSRKLTKSGLILTATFALFLAAILGYFKYNYWSAERDAREFCEGVPIGSDISDATAIAKREKVFFGGPPSPYAFYFFTVTGFDKAVCWVWVTSKGKVRSKRSEMEID